MFYSRPNITPLGWDLVGMPTPNGSRNFDARTSDGRPVDFRFSSGWLTVERGQPGASPDDEMEEVLSLQIAPFGIVDIFPDDICDILGLTVNGEKVALEWIPPQSRGFDWSGEMTYWRSSHRMDWADDIEKLVGRITETFPDSVLIQPSWETGLRVRCRQIKFLMKTDEMVSIGIDCDKARLEKMLAAETVSDEDFQSILAHRIAIIRWNHSGEDMTGAAFIKSKGADKLDLDYEVRAQRRYRIEMDFLTADARAQSIMKELLAIIDRHFCRGLRIVNLQTGEVIAEDLSDEEDTRSYSKTLRDWCLERPRRYLAVDLLSGKDRTFVGYRPVE
jgi:hypothetical protein